MMPEDLMTPDPSVRDFIGAALIGGAGAAVFWLFLFMCGYRPGGGDDHPPGR